MIVSEKAREKYITYLLQERRKEVVKWLEEMTKLDGIELRQELDLIDAITEENVSRETIEKHNMKVFIDDIEQIEVTEENMKRIAKIAKEHMEIQRI